MQQSQRWSARFLEAASLAGAQRLEETLQPPSEQEQTIRTAKTLARRRSALVRCLSDFVARVAHPGGSQVRVFAGDSGSIAGDDGNHLTLMLRRAGRIGVSREEFARFFVRPSDMDLAFSEPEPWELVL